MGYKTGGGNVQFYYPYKKAGGKGCSHAEGGFPLCNMGGREKFYPVLKGAQKVLNPRFSHFVAPLPVINDQTLKPKNHVPKCDRICWPIKNKMKY